MAIKNYTFFSPNGTEFPISATADRRLYLMLSGMNYGTFKMTHWASTTNTALNRVYVDTSLVIGGAYFELKTHAITLNSNSINFVHVNIDLSNTTSPVSLSVDTKDNSNSVDMNTTSSVLKKCIEIVTTSGTEITKVVEKEQETKLKKVTADVVTVPRFTKKVILPHNLTVDFVREGNMVTANFERQTITFISVGEESKAWETIPLGFRPVNNGRRCFGIQRNTGTSVVSDLLLIFGWDGGIRFTNGNSSTLIYSGSTSYFTDDPMPTI